MIPLEMCVQFQPAHAGPGFREVGIQGVEKLLNAENTPANSLRKIKVTRGCGTIGGGGGAFICERLPDVILCQFSSCNVTVGFQSSPFFKLL